MRENTGALEVYTDGSGNTTEIATEFREIFFFQVRGLKTTARQSLLNWLLDFNMQT